MKYWHRSKGNISLIGNDILQACCASKLENFSAKNKDFARCHLVSQNRDKQEVELHDSLLYIGIQIPINTSKLSRRNKHNKDFCEE